MKQIIGTLCAVALLSTSSTFAQSAAVSGSAQGVNAPASDITFSPSVNTGVRSYLNGKLSQGFNKGDAAHTVGPFITPQVEIGFKYPNFNGTLSYAAEITSARGFGDGKASSRTFGANTYTEHNPVAKFSVGANQWKFNMVADLKWHLENRDTTSTYSEYVLNPELERKMNDRLSLVVGYVMDRTNKFDRNLGAEGIASAEKAAVEAKSKSAEDQTKAAAALTKAQGNLGMMGVSPITTLHAATLKAKIKLGSGTSLDTYIRAGRVVANQATKAGNQYRAQADLTTGAVKNLTLALRYRIQLDDKDINAEGNQTLNLGRVIASYALSDNWSIDLQNTFDAVTNSKVGEKAVYENEQYLGATYKF